MHPHLAPVDLGQAIRLINHGPTTLVSAHHAGVDNVMAAAWVCALNFAPPRLTAIIDGETATRRLIESSGRFVIQVPTVAQLALTHAVGNTSLNDTPAKLARCGVEMFRLDGHPEPFVVGCSAWLLCHVLPGPANQEDHDLFIGEIIGAWADTRVFRDGRWHFETADPSWRSIHHVAGGQFYAIGDGLRPE